MNESGVDFSNLEKIKARIKIEKLECGCEL